MANNGLALFKGKDNKIYILEVLYEYRDKKLAGFRTKDDIYNGKFYKIEVSNGGYKVSEIDFSPKVRATVPVAIHFMKLLGSWVTYDITKQYSSPEEMIQNETVKKVLDKFYGLNEIRKIIKESINEIILTQEQPPAVSFTAVSIEDEFEKQKIEKVFEYLLKQKIIPKDFIQPRFKDGTLDYHMTIDTKEAPIIDDLNKSAILDINTIGISDKAVALGVSGYISKNEYQHITLAFKEFPKDSKEIQNWQPIDVPFSVTGIIREFDKDKNIIKKGVFGINNKNTFDEANQIQIGNFPEKGAPAGRSSMFPKEKI